MCSTYALLADLATAVERAASITVLLGYGHFVSFALVGNTWIMSDPSQDQPQIHADEGAGGFAMGLLHFFRTRPVVAAVVFFKSPPGSLIIDEVAAVKEWFLNADVIKRLRTDVQKSYNSSSARQQTFRST